MKASAIILALALTVGAVCAACNDDEPSPFDCGDSCVAECAFLKPAARAQCVNDCSVCDGHDSTVFTHPRPDGGPDAWSGDSSVRDDSGN